MTRQAPDSRNLADNEEAIELNQKFYTERYEEFGFSPRALDTSSDRWQRVRFSALVDLLKLPMGQEFTILDVGCGFADFYDYLIEEGYQPIYSGIDVTPGIVEKALENKGSKIEVQCVDYLGSHFASRFDYVACSGALNLKLVNSWEWIQSMIRRMTMDAEVAVAFNLTSVYTAPGYRQERTFYADPGEVFAYCKTLVERVSIRHDYMPNDFAVSLFKSPFE